MTSVREDIMTALREYEEEERKRLKEEVLRKAMEALEARRQQENQDVKLEFDGENLTWYEDDQPVWQKKAMSGREGYQCQEFQNIENKGPIPEGDWLVRQENLQNYDDLSKSQKLFSKFGAGEWPGGKMAWGNHRVWLTPNEKTNTYGRTHFSIHGGNSYGSSGSIDLTDDMDEFTRRLKGYHKDIPLQVRYNKRCW